MNGTDLEVIGLAVVLAINIIYSFALGHRIKQLNQRIDNINIERATHHDTSR